MKSKFKIKTLNGKKYTISDLLFEDRKFKIDYLVCDLSGWFTSKRALISTGVVKEVDLLAREILVDLDSAQLEKSPGYEFKTPISVEYENAYLKRYGFSSYFMMALDILRLRVGSTQDEMKIASQAVRNTRDQENHLRSICETDSYQVRTRDDENTMVSDWVIDIKNWRLSDIVCFGWLTEDKFKVQTQVVDSFSWMTKEITISLDFRSVMDQEPFKPSNAVNSNKEITEYDYYGRPRVSKSL